MKNKPLICTHKGCKKLQTGEGEFCEKHFPANKNEYLCPNCKEDLREVGFFTTENVNSDYSWEWNKKKGYFDSLAEDTNNADGIVSCLCGNCDEELDFYKIPNA